MRRLVQSRNALDLTRPRPEEYDGGELLAASAWLAVSPPVPLESDQPAVIEKQVSDLMSPEDFVAALEDITGP